MDSLTFLELKPWKYLLMAVYDWPKFSGSNSTLDCKECFVREDDSSLVHKAEKLDKLHEDKALDSCCIQGIPWGNKKLQVVVQPVGGGDGFFKSGVRGCGG